MTDTGDRRSAPAAQRATAETFGGFARDVARAARSLRRSPAFLAAAVLSLGLGLGAGVAGFAVVDAVRFRALPFPNSDRMVLISETPKTTGCPNLCDVNYKTFALLHAHEFKSIDALGGFTSGAKALGTGIDQSDVTAAIVSEAVFSMLAVKPELGRTFAPDEDRLGASGVMVIGHDLWENRFGKDPAILGKTYMLSDEPFTVIGVMPPGFTFETRSQAWLAASRYLDPRTGTSLRSINVLARLAPGATPEQLAGELRSLEAAANEGRRETARTTFTVAPLRTRYVNATKSHDLVFAAIVAAILLIGCANVASLVLVRALRHRRELAVRGALGATQGALARFLLAENTVIVVGGLAIGLALATASLRALQAAAPLQTGLRVPGMDYRMDLRVVAFAVLLAVVATILLSVAPVRLLGRTDLQRTLRDSAPTATARGGGFYTQQAFVVIQTACAVALLVATGLMVKTMTRFAGIDLGYDAAHVGYTAAIPAHSGRLPAVYMPASDRVLNAIAGLPGVEAAALRMQVPFAAAPARAPGVIVTTRDLEDAAMTLDDGQPVDPSLRPRSAFGVSPDYFRVMDIHMSSGRAFIASDDQSAPQVAVVNEWAASHWWPNQPAVGKTFSVDTAPGLRAMITVVGVVRDNLAGQSSVLLAKPGPEVFRPFKQANFWIVNYYFRTHSSPGKLVEEAKNAVMRVVPANGRAPGAVLSAQVDAQLQSVRTNAAQIAGFAVVGLVLAVTGLYGVLSYVVQQRTQEIGIRGVLGAGRQQILGMVLAHAMRLTLVGVIAGVVIAVLVMRLLTGLLFGTPTNDPLVYVVVAAVAIVVSLIASVFPALRAASVDPVIAIRAS